jgi:hypothetical protein
MSPKTRHILAIGIIGFIIAIMVDYFLKPRVSVGVKSALRTH